MVGAAGAVVRDVPVLDEATNLDAPDDFEMTLALPAELLGPSVGPVVSGARHESSRRYARMPPAAAPPTPPVVFFQ